MSPDDLRARWHKLSFGVNRSIRYHTRRRAFFDRLHYLNTVVALIFSSGAFVALLKDVPDPNLAMWAAAAIAVLSAINVVTRPSERARTHHDFARRFTALEQEMVGIANPSQDDFTRLTQARLSVEMDEPPPKIVLDAICHNEAVRALGEPPSQFISIGPMQRLLAQLFDFRSSNLAKGSEP